MRKIILVLAAVLLLPSAGRSQNTVTFVPGTVDSLVAGVAGTGTVALTLLDTIIVDFRARDLVTLPAVEHIHRDTSGLAQVIGTRGLPVVDTVRHANLGVWVRVDSIAGANGVHRAGTPGGWRGPRRVMVEIAPRIRSSTLSSADVTGAYIVVTDSIPGNTWTFFPVTIPGPVSDLRLRLRNVPTDTATTPSLHQDKVQWLVEGVSTSLDENSGASTNRQPNTSRARP